MAGRSGSAARRAVRRWSWRLLRREWRQQVLVIALLTVAVAASVFSATGAYNMASSRDADFGSADVRFQYRVTDPDAVEPFAESARQWFGPVDVIRHQTVAVAGSTTPIELRAHDNGGTFTEPMLTVRAGRLPASFGEVALTDESAALLDGDLGDEVRLGAEVATVVGLVENPADLDDEFALVTAEAIVAPESITLLAAADDELARTFHPSRAPGRSFFFEMRGQNESTTAAVLVMVVTAVAMVLVSLVAGAAFVTLAHRRQRQLGLLAAAGATPRQLRRAMVANGSAVGAVAAVLGVTGGLAGWLAFGPSLDGAAGHRIDRFSIPPWVPVTGMLLAVITASLAAWWPARAVARIPVTEAISARPPRPRSVRRPLAVAVLLLVGGITGIALGIDPNRDEVSPLLFIGGLVATVAATVLLAGPVLRVIARLAGRLPVAARLSVRDLARFQARSAAALGAISLGLGIAVAVVVIAAAAVPLAAGGNLSDRQLVAWTSPPGEFGDLRVPERSATQVASLDDAVAEMAAILGDDGAVVPVDAAVDPTLPDVQGGESFFPTAHLGRPVSERTVRDVGTMFVATPAVLAHLGLDPASFDGDDLILTPQPGDVYIAGDLRNTTFRRNPVPDEQVARVAVGEHTSTPRHLITERGLEAAGLVAMRVGWLLEGGESLAAADLTRIRAIAADAGVAVEVRDEKSSLTVVRTAASVAGVLVALSILAMTVGLLRSGAAQDVRTLTATGATTRTRRALTASTAGVLAVVGVVLGTGTAYAALIAGYWPETDRLGNVPVVHLAAIAVGLPLLATSISWAVSGRTPPTLRTPSP